MFRRARASGLRRPSLVLPEALEGRRFLSALHPASAAAGPPPAGTVTVAALVETTTVDSSAQWTVYGQTVALTAFVTGGGTGNVSFFSDGAPIGTAPVDARGQAKLFTAALPVGTHAITATYGGDATHAPSTSAPTTQSVSPALTTMRIDSSAGVVVNPILRPDHVVVVIVENNASNAVGDSANMPYFNQLAATGLVYGNSHGLNGSEQLFGQLNYLALYSGSTQGITDDFPGYSFEGPNLARSLHDAGLSFTGYVESLPAAGDTTTRFAGDPASPAHPDIYARRYNPMAQFTDVGPGKTNVDVNKPFSSFPTDYSTLPTVGYVIPNRLHNTHGSNEAHPFANDPSSYELRRRLADQWLEQNLGGYVEWARTNNSLLIVHTEDADRTRNYAAGGTTIVAGDPRLFVSGVNGSYVSHYGLLRTIQDMYGLAPIGAAASASRLDTDALGRLSPAGPAANALVTGQTVTYTATVSPLAPASGTPGGAVQFRLDGSDFGSPVVLSNGSASITVAAPTAGSHGVSAVYLGDHRFTGSTFVLTQPVEQAASTVSLVTSAPATSVGQSVTFTATVAPAAPGGGVPTGTVIFRDGDTVLGTVALDAAGRATLTVGSLTAGNHSITATYSGDVGFEGAGSEAVELEVRRAASSVSVASSAPTAFAGQTVTFTATVVAAAAGVAPTGTVTFFDGPTRLGSAPLDAAGMATFATSSLAAGAHSITAAYSGDANVIDAVSAPIAQQVNAATARPANDNFASRIVLFGRSLATTGNNVNATREPREPVHGGNGGKSVWWSWRAPSSGFVTIDTAGSSFRTLLGVYTGSSLTLLKKVAGLRVTFRGTASITFRAQAGKTYHIAVDGHNGATGDIRLRLTSWLGRPGRGDHDDDR